VDNTIEKICRLCGKPILVEQQEPFIPAEVADSPQLADGLRRLQETVNAMEVVHDECAAKEQAKHDEEERRQEWDVQRRVLFNQKRISEDTRAAKITLFGRHNPEFEKGNERAWSILRALSDRGRIINGSCWLYGPKGTAKTTAARCLLNRALYMGLSVRETTVPYVTRLVSTSGVWDELQGPDVLLLDDVDKGHWRDKRGAVTAFWELIDRRQWKCTILTGNMTIENFQETLLSSLDCENNHSLATTLISRLSAKYMQLAFGGPDLRSAATPKPVAIGLSPEHTPAVKAGSSVPLRNRQGELPQ
jgi:DNA replication protein DnaC